jgi:propanol-preferring alcohol dehydrogenase
MVLEAPNRPLQESNIGKPEPGPGQVLLAVSACGVCRTDLHVADGDLPDPRLPLVLGHEIVGKVVEIGSAVERFKVGEKSVIASASLGSAGLAENASTVALGERTSASEPDSRDTRSTVATPSLRLRTPGSVSPFPIPIPDGYSDLQAAPLLCAGLIGYRSLVAAGEARRLGLYGFGAAAHIMAQVARYQGRRLFAFTKPGDATGQEFARSLGAEWAGGSDENPPEALDAAIIFAPVGPLVPLALRHCRPGGTVVCAGIHMSDIPSFPYSILWGERVIRSVANLTRRDGEEFLRIAPAASVRTDTQPYSLPNANEALTDLREGRVTGAAVLLVGGEA